MRCVQCSGTGGKHKMDCGYAYHLGRCIGCSECEKWTNREDSEGEDDYWPIEDNDEADPYEEDSFIQMASPGSIYFDKNGGPVDCEGTDQRTGVDNLEAA